MDNDSKFEQRWKLHEFEIKFKLFLAALYCLTICIAIATVVDHFCR